MIPDLRAGPADLIIKLKLERRPRECGEWDAASGLLDACPDIYTLRLEMESYATPGILLDGFDHDGIHNNAATGALHDHDGGEHKGNSHGLDGAQHLT